MTDSLLVLNAGSSSIKFALFARERGSAEPRLTERGQIEGIGRQPRFQLSGTGKPVAPDAVAVAALANHEDAIDLLLDWIGRDRSLAAAGHRVVHGGTRYSKPQRITPEVIETLASFGPRAPHHQPHNVAAIRAIARRRPELPQVACFDTAFHAGQPELASRFALPRALHDQGLRRYGFHGLSYEYIVSALPGIMGALPRRLVVAHLGNGASMAAIKEGCSVATTMGFSTLDGLAMGTRSGAIDPGVLLYLLRERGLDEPALTDLLYNRSGLLGVSGESADMRTLLASPRPEAAEAVALFCYRIVRELGSLAAALGGLDALVFTGGIGEHAAAVRAQVCRDSRWLGLGLDEAANDAGGPRITTPGSAASAWVVPTNEELVIARHSERLIG
ncbi:MAG: acetate/propionate family kinase [Kiloniellales bacterium]